MQEKQVTMIKEDATWNEDLDCYHCPCLGSMCNDKDGYGYKWSAISFGENQPIIIRFCFNCGTQLLVENNQPKVVRRENCTTEELLSEALFVNSSIV